MGNVELSLEEYVRGDNGMNVLGRDQHMQRLRGLRDRI